MSEIKTGGLDQYGTEGFKQKQFGTAGIDAVNITSASHSSLNALLISTVLALGTIVRRNDAVSVVFTAECQAVAGIAQEERLHTTTNTGQTASFTARISLQIT